MAHSPAIKIIATHSTGGTFDDDAFVAGYIIGILHASFAQRKPVKPFIASEACLPQIDLLAMAFGYVVAWTPVRTGWVAVTCELLADEDVTPENIIAAPPAA